MGKRPPKLYVPPTFTGRLTVTVTTTDQDVTVVVQDRPVDGRTPARLWTRVIDRPRGKTNQDCVRAAVHALGAGLAGWIDLIDSDDIPLPVEW